MTPSSPQSNNGTTSLPTSATLGAGTTTNLTGTTPQQMVQQAQQHLGSMTDSLQQQAQTQANNGLSKAAKSLDTLAQTMHDFSDELRDRQETGIAGFADQAAGQVQRVAGYLRRDAGDVLRDATDFARRQPAAVLIGAFALGFLGMRFLKSSGATNGQTRTNPGSITSPGTMNPPTMYQNAANSPLGSQGMTNRPMPGTTTPLTNPGATNRPSTTGTPPTRPRS